MPDTSTERARRSRARKAAGVAWQPLACSSCGGPQRGRHGGLCSACWRQTPEGLADLSARVALYRVRRKRRNQ